MNNQAMAEGDIPCLAFRGAYYVDEPKLDGAYKINGQLGIAWRILGYRAEANEDTEWTGYLVNSGELYAHMIGDDRAFRVDQDDLIPLRAEDYCSGCGQIGCGWC